MNKLKARTLFVGLLAAIWATHAHAEPLDFTTRPVDLHTRDEAIATVGSLDYLGGLELRSRHPHFGGLSGMDVSKDGKRLSLVTDKGWWVTLQPVHDQQGRLIGVENGEIGKLLMPSGKPISDGGDGDGEAIARHRGALVVSFESDRKLYLYPSGENPLALKPRELRLPSALKGAPSNGQIEALTTLRGGRIFALTERFSHGEHAVIGWITQNRAWRHVIYQRSGAFFPTGAATLPDGDVILLERRFNWLAGVASRIVRIPTAKILPGAVIRGTEIAVLDPPFVVENFEAIDIRVGPTGETLIYILSDDNFQSIQRNLLLLFKLKK
jgi:hypothetical protein